MKQKLTTLLLAGILMFPSELFAQAYGWTQKADYGGFEMYDAFSFSIGTKGYAGSGFDVARTYKKDFWEWDQATNTWTQKADFAGGGREGARAFAVGSKGYVMSGYTPTFGLMTDLWEYDPSTNAWTQKQSHPGPKRYLGVAFSLNDKGYFGLGSVGGSTYYKDFYEYDPVSDSWTQKATFPSNARGAVSKFVINNIGYVGLGSNVSQGLNFADFYKYDGISNTWTKIADFIGPARNAAYSFAIKDSGYIVCGYNGLNGSNVIYPDFYRYDSNSDSWKQLPDFPGNKVFEGIYFEIGVCGYIGIGSDANNFSHYQKSFWEYGPLSVVPPVASFQSSDSVICALTCATFEDASSNATSWEWSFPGGFPISSTLQDPGDVCYMTDGSYDVTLIVSNSVGRDTSTITKYITVLKAPPTPTIIQNGDSLICSYDTSYVLYQWYLNGSAIPGATDSFYVHQQSGNYNLAVTNKDGCSIAVGIILGLAEGKSSAIKITPNPAEEEIYFNLTEVKEIDVRIFDMAGRGLMHVFINNQQKINIADLTKGTYIISLKSEDKHWITKFVKN